MAHSFGRNQKKKQKLITRQTKPRCKISNHRSFCIINDKAIFQFYLLNSEFILSNRKLKWIKHWDGARATKCPWCECTLNCWNCCAFVQWEKQRKTYTWIENRHTSINWVEWYFEVCLFDIHSAQCSFHMHAEPWTHIFIKWNQLKCNSCVFFFCLPRAMN